MDNERYDQAYIEELAHKWKEGTLTTEEQAYFDSWYEKHLNSTIEIKSDFAESSDELKHRMHMRLIKSVRRADNKVIPMFWKRLLIAAATIAVLIGLVLTLYKARQPKRLTVDLKPHPTYIAPGSDKAILTLANGKKISIGKESNGLIATQAGVQIQNTSSGKIIYTAQNQSSDQPSQFNTIQTPRAGKFQLQLPDGTKVWLNAATTLHYPVVFQGGTRVVELNGEAYFEVNKDKHKPFIVSSNGQKVTVLGTHFNINAYQDEAHVKTTLLEGSVRVSADSHDALLRPGEESTLNNKLITVSKADVHLATAWKDGQMAFAHTDLKSALRQISRWYNIDVTYIGDVPDISISGDASMDADLSVMLKMLGFYNVQYIQQGRTLIIIK